MIEKALQNFRKKYPQYNDLSDEQILKGLHQKFYSDLPYDKFVNAFVFKFGGPYEVKERRPKQPVKAKLITVSGEARPLPEPSLTPPTPQRRDAAPPLPDAAGEGSPPFPLPQNLQMVTAAADRLQTAQPEGGLAAKNVPLAVGDNIGYDQPTLTQQEPKYPSTPKLEAARPRTFFQNLKESFKRTMEDVAIDQMAYESAIGLRSDADWMELEQQFYERAKRDPIEAKNWLQKILIGAVGMAGPMAKGTLEGAIYGGALAGAVAAAGQAGPQILAPEEVFTVPAAASVGTMIGSAQYWYRQGVGDLYRDLRREGIPQPVASVVAQAAGVPYAAIEFSQASKIFPGLKKEANRIIANTAKKYIKEFAKKYGANWLQEVGEEVLQEFSQMVFHDAAVQLSNKIAGTDKKGYGLKDYFQRTLQTFIDSAGPMAILLGGHAVGEIGVDAANAVIEQQQEKQTDKRFEQVLEHIARQEALNVQRPGGPVRAGETLEEFKRRQLHERINQRAEQAKEKPQPQQTVDKEKVERVKRRFKKGAVPPPEKPVTEPLTEQVPITVQPELPLGEKTKDKRQKTKEGKTPANVVETEKFGKLEILKDDGALVTVRNEQGNVFQIGKKALEKEIENATRLRKDAGQIREGRDVPEGGKAEGRTDLEQPAPGESGVSGIRPEESGAGEEAVQKPKEKAPVEYVGLQFVPGSKKAVVLVNDQSGSTIGYRPELHELSESDRKKLEQEAKDVKIIPYERFMDEVKAYRAEQEAKQKNEQNVIELPPLKKGQDVRNWWKYDLTPAGRREAVRRAGLKSSVAKKSALHLTDEEVAKLRDIVQKEEPEITEEKPVAKAEEKVAEKQVEPEGEVKKEPWEMTIEEYVKKYPNRKELVELAYKEYKRVQKKIDNIDDNAWKMTNTEWINRKFFEPPISLQKWGNLNERFLTTWEAEILNDFLRKRPDLKNIPKAEPGKFPHPKHIDLLVDEYEGYVRKPGLWSLQDFTELHKKRIEKAIKEGKPVPSKVLKDYPDLTEKISSNKSEQLKEESREKIEKVKKKAKSKRKKKETKLVAGIFLEGEEQATEEKAEIDVGDIVIPKEGSGLKREPVKVRWKSGDKIRTDKYGKMTFNIDDFELYEPEGESAVKETGKEEKKYEPSGTETERAGVLEGLPAGEVQRIEENRPNKPESRAKSQRDAGTVQRTEKEPAGTLGKRSAVQRGTANRRNYRIDPKTDDPAREAFTVRKKAERNIESIRLLKQLEEEKRLPTDEEKKILIQYVGWGAMPQVFNPYGEHTDLYKELTNLLTKEEFEAARASTTSAYFTNFDVIQGVWDLVKRLGFTGGNILEPAMGTGHFFGLMPEDISGNSSLMGIELDSITGRIARMLYPDAEIEINGFEKTYLIDNFYDLIISNVPFGDFSIFDETEPNAKFNRLKFKIHDFFFAKSIEKVRPGGFLVFITSRYTMDKIDETLRQYVSDKADLVGAIRLPNTAFKKNANTEVVADIIILRKRAENEAPSGESWVKAVQKTGKMQDKGWGGQVYTFDVPYYINEYFDRHPEMILGKPALSGSMYSGDEYTVESDGRDLKEALQEAIQHLPENIFVPQEPRKAERPVPRKEFGKLKEGNIIKKGNKIYQKVGNKLKEVTVKGKEKKRVEGLIKIRDTAKELLNKEQEAANEKELKKLRKKLNEVYDAFVKEFGPIRKPANNNVFKGDPDFAFIRALEIEDPETKAIRKAAIFSSRVFNPQPKVTSVETADEALIVSLNETGRVDIERMKELTGFSEEHILDELGDKIFFNPATKQYETREEYLSGDVKQKLKEAIAAAKIDKRYEKNVEALKAVQPEDIPYYEIKAELGSSWIPPEYVKQFIVELLDVWEDTIDVRYIPTQATWVIEKKNKWQLNSSIKNNETYGTPHRSAIHLIEAALNFKQVNVYDQMPNGERVLNRDATVEARAKLEEIKERFAEWVWENEERRKTLQDIYNEQYNRYKQREYDGSHLTFPGMANTIDGQPFELRDYQKNAVWRIIQNRTALLAHEVGAGKTFTMIASAMELKRMGVINKPLFAVPKHLVQQFAEDFQKLYPGSKVLVTSEKDFAKGKRQELMSRIATENWDAIIVAHTQLGMLPVKDETWEAYLREQIAELEEMIMVEARENGKRNNRVIKELEKAKRRLEDRLRRKAAREKKDVTIHFEDLGIDQLYIDEAHMFKNIQYPTRMQVPGIGRTTSQRAQDLAIKIHYLFKQNGGNKGIVFATGTPVSNMLSEVYVMQRYLQPDILKKHMLDYFDAWAHDFGEIITEMEIPPEGKGFRGMSRFNGLKNLPELMRIYGQVIDIIRIEDIPEVNKYRPKIKGGKHKIIISPASDEQIEFIKHLAERAEKVRNKEVKPTEDNMLMITNDGRKAVLDMRLIDENYPDYPDSKVNKAVENIFNIWKRTKKDRLTQLVFLDLGTPTGEVYNLYDDIRNKLVEKGIPKKEIAFIHEYKSKEAKRKLFEQVRKGTIRILIGSTEKMGAGMNVQDKLIAAHHLDAPWRPADIEQRDGRIIRFGNKNKEVEIYRYISQGRGEIIGFDAYIWQLLENKARAISQAMTANPTVRTVEESEKRALTYAEVKAIATGDPLIMEKVQVDNDLQQLEQRYKNFEQQKTRLKSNKAMVLSTIATVEERIPKLKDDIKALPDDNVIHLDGKEYDLSKKEQKKAAGEVVHNAVEKAKVGLEPKAVLYGKWGYFDIIVEARTTDNGREGEIVLRRNLEYVAKVYLNLSPVRTMTAFLNIQEEMDKELNVAESTLAEQQKKLKEIEDQLEKGFPQQDELEKLRQRKAEIDAQLGVKEAEVEAEPEIEEPAAEGGEEAEEMAFAVREPKKPADLIVEGGGQEQLSTKTLLKRLRALFPEVQFRKKNLDRWSKEIQAKYYKTGLIKSRSEVDIDAIAHELGHYLQDIVFRRMKVDEDFGNDILNEELRNLDYDQEQRRTAEGFAEFLRLWLSGENTRSVAPNFTEFFEKNFLPVHDKKGRFRKAKKLIMAFREQGIENFVRAQAGLDNPRSRLKRIRETLKEIGDSPFEHNVSKIALLYQRFKQKFIDDAAVVEWLLKKMLGANYYGLRAKENPIHIYRNFKMKAGAMAEEMINTGVYDIHTGKTITRGIRQILEDVVKRGHRLDDFLVYIYAKHALTWWNPVEEGLPPKNPGISEEQARYIVEKYQNKDFDELGAEVTKYFDELLRMVMREGGISEELYVKMTERYPYYIPLMRNLLSDKDLVYAISKRGFANQPSPIKKAKGSDLPLEPMIHAWIRHTERMVLWAQKARLMNALVNLTEFDGISALIKKTAPPVEAKSVRVSDLVDMLADMGVVEPTEDVAEMDERLNLFFTQVYFNKQGVPVVSVWENGKRKWYEVHPELYRFITQLDAKPISGLAKFLAPFARGVRLGATGINPSFIFIRNAMRDAFEGTIMSTSGRTIPLHNTFTGIISELMKGKDVSAVLRQLGIDPKMAELYSRAGGVVSTMAGYDRTKLEAMADLLVERVEGNTIKFGMKHPIEGLRLLFSAIENATRIDEFKKVYYDVLKQTGDEEEAFARAARASQDVTTDFARSGTVGRELNQIIPFYNAGIQGFHKFIRAFGGEKEIVGYEPYTQKPIYSRINAAKRFAKGMVWLVGLSLLSYFMRDDDEWEKMDPHFRYNYFHFWINGTHIIIPAPFVVGAAFHGATQTLLLEYRNDPEVTEDYLKYLFYEQFIQLFPLPMNLAGLGPYIQVMSNKDWAGRPIEPKYARETKAPSEITYPWTTKTAETAVKKILKPLGIDGISPIQLEFLLNAYTGGLFNRVVRPIEHVTGIKEQEKSDELADLPVIGTLFARNMPMRNKYTQRFYRDYREMLQRRKSDNPHPLEPFIKVTMRRIRAIQRNKNLSKKEKDKRIATLITENWRKVAKWENEDQERLKVLRIKVKARKFKPDEWFEYLYLTAKYGQKNKRMEKQFAQ